MALKEEQQFLKGDGTGQNLLGIIPQATAYETARNVSGDTWFDTLAHAIAQAQVALLPLLSRRVDILRFTLVEPQILLETDARGRGNWAFGEPAKTPQGPSDPLGDAAGAFGLGEFAVDNGSLTWRDGRTQETTSVRIDRLYLRARDPQKLAVRSRVNGELRQSSTTANMIWTCAELIHFFSRNFTLKPGMVIITGTPSGTAWSADKDLGGKGVTQPGLVPATRYCLPGDVVECEVEGIGALRNPVAEAQRAAAGVAAE